MEQEVAAPSVANGDEPPMSLMPVLFSGQRSSAAPSIDPQATLHKKDSGPTTGSGSSNGSSMYPATRALKIEADQSDLLLAVVECLAALETEIAKPLIEVSLLLHLLDAIWSRVVLLLYSPQSSVSVWRETISSAAVCDAFSDLTRLIDGIASAKQQPKLSDSSSRTASGTRHYGIFVSTTGSKRAQVKKILKHLQQLLEKQHKHVSTPLKQRVESFLKPCAAALGRSTVSTVHTLTAVFGLHSLYVLLATSVLHDWVALLVCALPLIVVDAALSFVALRHMCSCDAKGSSIDVLSVACPFVCVVPPTVAVLCSFNTDSFAHNSTSFVGAIIFIQIASMVSWLLCKRLLWGFVAMLASQAALAVFFFALSNVTATVDVGVRVALFAAPILLFPLTAFHQSPPDYFPSAELVGRLRFINQPQPSTNAGCRGHVAVLPTSPLAGSGGASLSQSLAHSTFSTSLGDTNGQADDLSSLQVKMTQGATTVSSSLPLHRLEMILQKAVVVVRNDGARILECSTMLPQLLHEDVNTIVGNSLHKYFYSGRNYCGVLPESGAPFLVPSGVCRVVSNPNALVHCAALFTLSEYSVLLISPQIGPADVHWVSLAVAEPLQQLLDPLCPAANNGDLLRTIVPPLMMLNAYTDHIRTVGSRRPVEAFHLHDLLATLSSQNPVVNATLEDLQLKFKVRANKEQTKEFFGTLLELLAQQYTSVISFTHREQTHQSLRITHSLVGDVAASFFEAFSIAPESMIGHVTGDEVATVPPPNTDSMGTVAHHNKFSPAERAENPLSVQEFSPERNTNVASSQKADPQTVAIIRELRKTASDGGFLFYLDGTRTLGIEMPLAFRRHIADRSVAETTGNPSVLIVEPHRQFAGKLSQFMWDRNVSVRLETSFKSISRTKIHQFACIILPVKLFTATLTAPLRDLFPYAAIVVTTSTPMSAAEAKALSPHIDYVLPMHLLHQSTIFDRLLEDIRFRSQFVPDITSKVTNYENPEEQVLLGRGGEAKVFHVKVDGVHLAMKMIDKNSEEEALQSHGMERFKAMNVPHPNIVQVKRVEEPVAIGDGKWLVRSFMELCITFTLRRRLEYRPLGSVEAATYTKDLLSALFFLKESGFFAGDLKAENILFGTNGRVKINDYYTDLCTLGWQAPELLLKLDPTVPRVQRHLRGDVWSLGCVMLEMMHGRNYIPFAKDQHELRRVFTEAHEKQIVDVDIPDANDAGPICEEWRDFTLQCLTLDPAQRPTVEQLQGHPFVTHTPLRDEQPLPVALHAEDAQRSATTSSGSSPGPQQQQVAPPGASMASMDDWETDFGDEDWEC